MSMGWVLFFDGDCAFCSASVRRAVKLDTHKRLKFAPLQGKLAAEQGFGGNAAKQGGTMVLMRESDGKIFQRSEALIELTRVLGGWWRLLTPVKFVPRFIRDAAYQWFADHRYWFSEKGGFCEMPDPEVQKRLLE
ncbi:DCC1-like thiol-disulfide oxidoreductase family protein [Luteolibacter sp. SL250]|uniref:thiol-disulfide oxidoreductase DCC family protein n=1 Tax=Luteolibacter sp. SL250 TaxID=2995170 RepID=UPI00226FCB13|nr:DCC1-like thiol-disulfide oxidoreductase family protein [Luteolibacter sp. SL250]WAC21291.1 DCC1-like thiol-disulfide oxidoreductase family protein [Luteolibacter sp. SL250]